MNNNIIEIDKLGLQFHKTLQKIMSFKDVYLSFFKGWREIRQSNYWWVLRDISFSVKKGETLAIIGRNGAGKSTLLRVIAGMIAYDEGEVRVYGRPLLLTPGLGFRDELSGRENIEVGGVILGLTKRKVREKMDEIIDFAELRDAIDRPFKYFSDGMKARLIFSVATSVEPEILMLDELLSAGDISFAEKAATRMDQLITQAQTIIIVTHNLKFVRDHCTKALYLKDGRVKYFGKPDEAVGLFEDDVAKGI